MTQTLVKTEAEKRMVGEAAAALVEDGMTVGLGTGSTVAYLLPALASRRLDISCIATSPRTEEEARASGLRVEPFERFDRLDIAIDGADEVAPSGWLVKGGGGAHTREKIVAAATDHFVVIVSAEKLVASLVAPVPLEVLAFGADATLRAVGHAQLRDAPPTPDGGLLADYFGPIEDARQLATRLAATPGVVEHGLFAPDLVDEIFVAHGEGIHREVFP